MYTYLNIPTELFSRAAFVAMIFLVILTYVFDQRISAGYQLRVPSPKILLIVIYALCILLVLFVPSIDGSVFVSFGSISTVNWFRIVAGLMLGLFLPGFVFISFFKNKLGLILLLTASVLLSISFNSIV